MWGVKCRFDAKCGEIVEKSLLFIPGEVVAIVPISSGLFVDRTTKIQKFDNSLWGEVVTLDFFWLAIYDNGLLKRLGFANGVGETD